MINLVPPAARAQIIKEYWFRVIAVWMFLLGTGCLVVASLLLPTYMLLRNELTSLRNQVMDNEVKVANFTSSATELRKAMDQTNILLSGQSMVAATAYDERLVALAGDSVQINAISFIQSTTSTKIEVSGIAETRTALASFRDAVEAAPEFTDALLPISSLIKDRELDFVLTITGTSTTVTP